MATIEELLNLPDGDIQSLSKMTDEALINYFKPAFILEPKPVEIAQAVGQEEKDDDVDNDGEKRGTKKFKKSTQTDMLVGDVSSDNPIAKASNRGRPRKKKDENASLFADVEKILEEESLGEVSSVESDKDEDNLS